MVVEATELRELELHAEGFEYVIGVDEVGRGAIAGPVVVVAALRRRASSPAPAGLRDSKLLSPAQRERMAPLAASWAEHWALGSASAIEIDEHGIIACLQLAADRALTEIWSAGFAPERSVVLLDGTHNWLTGLRPQPAAIRVQAKADRDCSIVAAASVIAKVDRDRTMTLAHPAAPMYGWSGNKGYGSAVHLAAIAEYGPHELHRKTWIRGAEATT
ncbi:MAG: ribonuclease HII [Agromyces sp.]